MRRRLMLIYHPVGTCRMSDTAERRGRRQPAAGARASTGCRVVDASIMPLIPGGNTHAPTVMVAERGGRPDPLAGKNIRGVIIHEG